MKNYFALLAILFLAGVLCVGAQDSQTAVEHYSKGIDAFRKGELEDAVRFFTICEENRIKDEYHFDNTSNAYQWLAYCYYLSGNETKAIESDPLYYQVQPEDLRICEASLALENERMALVKDSNFVQAFVKAVEMLEHDRKTFGEKHIFVGNDLWTISQMAFRCDDKSIKDKAYDYMKMAETFFRQNFPQCTNLLTYLVMDRAYAYYYDQNFTSASMALEEYFSEYHGKHTYTIQEIYALKLNAFLYFEQGDYTKSEETFTSILMNERYKKEKGEYEQALDDCIAYFSYTPDLQTTEKWTTYKCDYMAENYGKESLQYVRSISQLTDTYYNHADYLKNLYLCTTFMACVQQSQIMDALSREAQMDDLFSIDTDSLMLTPILNIVSKMIDAFSNQPDTDWSFLDMICSTFYEDNNTWTKHSDTPLGKSMKDLYLNIQLKRTDLMYIEGKKQEAIAILEDMIRMDVFQRDSTMYSDLLNACALKYMYDGDLRQATSMMEKSFSYNPTNMILELNLAALYMLTKSKDSSTIKEMIADGYAKNQAYVLSFLLSLTRTNREILWETQKNVFDGFNTLSVMKDGKDETLNRIAYNSLLLSRGFLLKSDTYFRQKVLEINNPTLNEFLIEMDDLKKTSIDDHNGKDILERRIFIESEILKAVSEKGDPSDIFSYSWEKVQNALPDNNSISVEFFYTSASILCPEDSYYALVLKKGWKAPRLIKLDFPADISTANPERLYASDELYTGIWNKIIKTSGIRKGGSIFFAANYEFLYTALEYTLTPEKESFFSTYNVYRLSSTGELCQKKDKAEKPSSIVLYGGLDYQSEQSANTGTLVRSAVRGLPPLLGSLNEARMIYDLFKGKYSDKEAHIFTDKNGTEATFRAMDGHSSGIIHLATHGGFLNLPRSVMDNASLFLSGSEPAFNDDEHQPTADDGILSANEISVMNLSATDLVTLSACQSALGYVGSDGVFGLQRGFKLAGVHSILMTLWEVDDEATSYFMIEFYKNLFNGKSKYESLKIAQNSIRLNQEHPEWNSPYYWAAFILLDGLD